MPTYLHALDGRIRARFPKLRGSRRDAAQLRKELRARPGITSAEVSLLTGSVLVEYDEGRLSTSDIFDALEIEALTGGARQGVLQKTGPSDQRKEVRDAVAEQLIGFAAERLLLAAIA